MIDDTILEGRIPRLGTITVGHGVESTSKAGNTYAKPTKSETLVLHTNDPELANAAQMTFGGDIATDSPTWDYDVITDQTAIPVTIFAPGFRQHLELWRTAECARRCDGITMSTESGKPTSKPCVCAVEISQGQDRKCKPHTTLPVILDLGVDRIGVWEVRSTAWGTARQIKGAVQMIDVAGLTGPVSGAVSMHVRQVRDSAGKVWDAAEIQVAIEGQTPDVTGGDRPVLTSPETPPDRPRRPLPSPPVGTPGPGGFGHPADSL